MIPVLLVLVLSGKLCAQRGLNTLEVDRHSYSLYDQKEWVDLIRYASNARKEGIDFYYLQYRTAIALYELKRYRQATPYFRKITEQNPEDLVAREYLYYSYLSSARFDDARMLSRNSDSNFRNRIGTRRENSFISSAGTEYKAYLFDDYTVQGLSSAADLRQKVRNSLDYANVYFRHNIGGRFTLLHAFTVLWGRNRVSDSILVVDQFDEKLTQFQYYISGKYHFGDGYDMKIGFHYVRTVLDGLNPGFGMGMGHFRPGMKYLYSRVENGYAAYLGFSKSLSVFNFRLSGTVTDLNGGMNFYPSIGFDYYPLGNTNLYLSIDLSESFSTEDLLFDPGLVMKGKVGIRLFEPLWVEPFVQFGKVSNYADEEAFVIYNSHDVIESWYGSKLSLYLSQYRLNLYYIFQGYGNINYYRLEGNQEAVKYNVASHLIGLRWIMNN